MCNLCLENGKPNHKWIKPEAYSGEVGKLIINHNCQAICRGFTLIIPHCSVREAEFKFPLTQVYVDWVRKHEKSSFTPECNWGLDMCHECRIKKLEQDISFNPNDQKLKQALSELKKITGNDNPRERERERERERANSNSDCWIRGYN